MKPGLSVIVCCYNSETRLPETLKHLLGQKGVSFDWEIIVVDNASTDKTTAIAQEILQSQTSSAKFKVVQETQPGLSSARRKGYLSSTYDLLLFCDDDNWMASDYFQLAVETMNANEQVGILGGHGVAVFEKNKPAWFDKYQINFAVGEQGGNDKQLSIVQGVYGAGFIVRREIFELLNRIPFESILSDRKGSQLMSGGDTELCIVTQYLGYSIGYNPQLKFKHLMTVPRMNWDYLKKLYFGFGRMRLYLHVYRQLEGKNEIPGNELSLPLWLDKYIHRMKELKSFLPGVLFKQKEEGNDEVLKYFALKGEMHELWLLKNKYNEVFFKIINLKKKIAELRDKPKQQTI